MLPESVSREFVLATWQEVFAPYPPNGHWYLSEPCGIQQGDVVFDVGASEGFFAHLALERGAKHVICFEPSPEWCEGLIRTFAEEVGSHRMLIETMLIGLPQKQPVAESVDDLVFNRGISCPTFIKVDVEGAELEVLQSAKRVISEFKPRVAVAVYHTSAESERCARFLHACHPDYRIEFRGAARSLDNGDMVPQILNAWPDADQPQPEGRGTAYWSEGESALRRLS